MFDRSTKSLRTVIDIGSEVYGPVRSQGYLEIRGLIAGPILHDGTLVIAKGGRCEGNVQATEMVVAGEAKGDVTVTGRLEIEATGRLIGNAVYGTIIVAAGGVFHGNIRMQESPERISESAGYPPSGSARLSAPEPNRFPAPEPARLSASDSGRHAAPEPARYPVPEEADSAGQPTSRKSAILTIRSPLQGEEPQPKPRWGAALLRAAGLRSRDVVDRMA